jgi:drug/metabolite transporter (DMT)-like permease
LLFFTLVSMVLGALLACFTWNPLSSENFQILFGIGILGGTAQCLMTQAFCMVPASVLAPFDYIALLWGLALDYYLFHCMLTLSGLVGAGFIMAAGGLMLFHEKKKLG